MLIPLAPYLYTSGELERQDALVGGGGEGEGYIGVPIPSYNELLPRPSING